MRVNYAQAVYGPEEIAAVVAVLENAPEALMTGPNVETFEARVAGLFGNTHGVMVNSGSSANLIAVAASALPDRSEVITPALTFSTTVAPLVQNGLRPVFVDVEPDTYNIDASDLTSALTSLTSAVMIPNLLGNLPDWTAIRSFADRHSLWVIEDSADTIGSTLDGAPTGSLSDVATTSFYASHVMTAGGFGGMLTTSDPAVADRARLLRGWGRTSSVRAESEDIADRFDVAVDGIEYDAKFMFTAMGYNLLPSELSAAFGLVQLERLTDYSNRRKRNFGQLHEAFSRYDDWFVLPRQNVAADTPWLAFPLIVRQEAPFTRRELQTVFERADIQTRVIFTGNVLRQPGFASLADGQPIDAFPNADRVMEGGILLGCHHGMTPVQLDYVIDTFDQFAGTAGK